MCHCQSMYCVYLYCVSVYLYCVCVAFFAKDDGKHVLTATSVKVPECPLVPGLIRMVCVCKCVCHCVCACVRVCCEVIVAW